jgi:tRNA(Ile)-lysidine synthase
LPADPPLIERLRRTNAERDLLRPGDRVLIAVSGGADSLALLHALHTLRDELQIQVAAGHLSHRMRGPEGEADAAFVRETARTWGIPVEVRSRDVPALARRLGISLEEAGRAARYRFFGRAARRTGCTVIATGHTADDRAETVLLNLFRGTGLDGLAGIPARRPLRADRPGPDVIRPLIDTTRAAVLQYGAIHGLQPRQDDTNESPAFLRNRIRRELLPLLEAEYSPALRRHLLRLSDLAAEETAHLITQARELLEAAASDGPVSSSLRLSLTTLADAPGVLARRALRLAVQSLESGPPPEWAVVERLLSLARGERPGFVLPGGRIAVRAAAEALIFEPVCPAPEFEPDEAAPLAVPGTTPLPWGGGVITVEVLGVGGWVLGEGGALSLVTPNPQPPTPNPQPLIPHEALLDGALLSGPLAVRPPRPGDRIQPLGMAGHRKLQDLMTDRKVPRAVRRRLPVVCDAEKIVWVAGCCLSERVKVSAATAEALLLVWQNSSGLSPHD